MQFPCGAFKPASLTIANFVKSHGRVCKVLGREKFQGEREREKRRRKREGRNGGGGGRIGERVKGKRRGEVGEEGN